MIPAALLSLVTGWVGPKFAKPLIYAAAILLAIGLLFGGKAIYDHRLISRHDAKQNAAVANAVVQADRQAGEQKQQRDSDFANSQGAIANAVGNAVRSNPSPKPVGPITSAYYDELRRQQQARRK